MTTPVRRLMTGRDPAEAHRAATPLELFVDLTFVVAVAQCAANLHHSIADAHVADAVQVYPMVFFAIWWAWMNFTWFASAYDTDDVTYRVAAFVQMAGVLVLAAGVTEAFAGDFTIVTIGYVVMRMGLVSQWLRAAHEHPERRTTAHRYAAGLVVLQVGWVGLLLVPSAFLRLGFWTLVVLELLVPYLAERRGTTPWHPRHLAERYGLFTIIVLGESILSVTNGIRDALDGGAGLGDLAVVAVGGLLIVVGMWWLYFDQPVDLETERSRVADRPWRPFVWGYGHYFVFGSAAATGAGLAVAVDQAAGASDESDLVVGLATTIPLALFTLVVWALHDAETSRGHRRIRAWLVASLIVGASWTPEPLLVSGVVLAVAVAQDVAASALGARRLVDQSTL